MAASILWFRRDLRLADNPALASALQAGREVIPVFIYCPEEDVAWPMGSASRWWLHHSLVALEGSLRGLGSRLVVRRGPSLECLRDLIRQTGTRQVFWNRQYEPAAIARDKIVKHTLRNDGLEVTSFNGALLYEPWEISRGQGEPYRVFTPFWKALLKSGLDRTISPMPAGLPPVSDGLESLLIEALGLLPKIPWDAGFREVWRPGEQGALERLDEFIAEALAGYAAGRDLPAEAGTSRLSPHLHFGEIGPGQIVRAVLHRLPPADGGEGAGSFLRELGWREFAHHLLYHFPHTPELPLDERFRKFPWTTAQTPGSLGISPTLPMTPGTTDSKEGRSSEAGRLSPTEALRAWERGETGIPLVDAGMRELWNTGWMHNRVRMVVASFLVKNLGLHWLEGARWFWDTLVDADLANNTLGWQWVAGCGADAAPYFRIFNPVLQGARFDSSGEYVRRWLPVLARMPDKHIHQPWDAPAGVLEASGIRLGIDYPSPIVELKASREAALAAYRQFSEKGL